MKEAEMFDELTPEQEAALDKVWDQIGAEEGGKTATTLDSLLERLK